MAELKYTKSTTAYKGMPQLTTAASDQQIATNQRLNKFLNTAGQFFQEQAIDYATDQAIEDAIRNPITSEQLAQARRTGDNPVAKYLEGGTAYNTAITKTLGQQVAGELNIELAKYNSDILEQVRLGKFENSEEVLAKLKEPIQAQVEFFAGIDPEMAQSYGSKATMAARNVYQTSNNIFAQQKENQAQVNAYTAISQEVSNYSKYRAANPNASIQKLKEYRETVIKFVTDTTLSMSRDQLKLKQDLTKALQDVDDLTVAKDIAIVYTGDNINEVLNDLDKYDPTKLDFNKAYSGDKLSPEQAELAKYYHDMSIEKQKAFQKQIKYELGIANSDLAAKKEQLNRDIAEAKKFIDYGKEIPQDKIDIINNNIKPDAFNYSAWKTLEKMSNNIPILNTTPYPDLIEELQEYTAKKTNINYQPTIEEIDEHIFLASYVNNLNDQLKADNVKTRLSRDGRYNALDFTSLELKQQVSQRILDLESTGPRYGLNNRQSTQNILSKEETQSFVAIYNQGNAETRVALLSNLQDGFGTNKAKVLSQLSNNGLPMTAQLSAYFSEPNITQQFIQFDESAKQAVLNNYLKDLPGTTTLPTIREEIAEGLKPLREVVMMNSRNDPATAAAKIDNMIDVLSYYTINEMMAGGKSLKDAQNSAIELITGDKGFAIESTYYIPRIYNGLPLGNLVEEAIVKKAELIQDKYLGKFNAVAFRSIDPKVTPKMLTQATKDNMEDNGEWRNTADGTGLIFGIVFPGGGFTPVINKDGNTLQFDFDDISMTIKGIDTEILPPIPYPIGFGFTSSKEYNEAILKRAKRRDAEKAKAAKKNKGK